MKRRKFLQLLSFAPAIPALAKLPEPKPQFDFNFGERSFVYPPPDGFKVMGTYVGDGKAEQFIPHNFGFKPRMILIKRVDCWEMKKL